MRRSTLSAATALLAGSLLAADSSPKGDVAIAAKKLGDQTNYSWKTTVVVPEGAPFRPGPTEGKIEKDGLAHITMSFFDNPVQIVIKGEKGTFTDQDGAWRSVTEAENEEGPGQFMALLVRNYRTPAKEAAELASFAKELKKDGEAFASDLTEDGAKAFLTFRRGTTAGDGPSVSNAKGSVKFWLKDGALTKYEYKLKGTVNWGGNEFENDRTTTVEVKDVGTTKLNVPEAAQKKLL